MYVVCTCAYKRSSVYKSYKRINTHFTKVQVQTKYVCGKKLNYLNLKNKIAISLQRQNNIFNLLLFRQYKGDVTGDMNICYLLVALKRIIYSLLLPISFVQKSRLQLHFSLQNVKFSQTVRFLTIHRSTRLVFGLSLFLWVYTQQRVYLKSVHLFLRRRPTTFNYILLSFLLKNKQVKDLYSLSNF